MKTRIECAECGAKIAVPEGKRSGRCPQCHTIVRVYREPDLPSATPITSPAAPEIAAPRPVATPETVTRNHTTSQTVMRPIDYEILATEIWRTMPDWRIVRIIGWGVLYSIVASAIVCVIFSLAISFLLVIVRGLA